MTSTTTDRGFEMMHAGLNLIQQALSIYDADLRLAVANSRFQEMFGLPDALVRPGARFGDTIRHLAETGDYGEVGDIEAFVAARVAQARAFEPHYMERRRPAGQWISVEGSPLRRGGWVAVYTDITAIKTQEARQRLKGAQLSEALLTRSEELAASNRELAATIHALDAARREATDAEARSRMTAEMMPAHIAHIGRDRRYTYSNRKLADVVPDRPREIVGQHASEALGPDAWRGIRAPLDAAMNGHATVTEIDIDDASRRIRVALTPDIDADGVVQGAYVLSMDITAESQARAALLQTRKRELAAQLTSGLAHDFSNLLTIILGLQEQLDAEPGLSEEGRAAVATVRAAARRGGALLDRLAEVSGQRELQVTAVGVDEILSDLRALSRAALPDGVTLATANLGIDRPLLLDRGALQDSLLNLVLNARDATDGAGRISVEVGPRGNTWIEFSVQDTGPGFSIQALDHALDPFFTTKTGEEGSGLGLTMVYDFAQLSGGRVRIANTGEGARVTIQLPLRPAPIAPASDGMVLLVEDREEIRVSVRTMLRDLGLSVVEADSAEEALILADVPGISHLVTDIQLSGALSGLDLAECLQRNGRDMPVLMMTGLPADDPVRRKAAARFPLLPKPFGADDLAARLQDLHP